MGCPRGWARADRSVDWRRRLTPTAAARQIARLRASRDKRRGRQGRSVSVRATSAARSCRGVYRRSSVDRSFAHLAAAAVATGPPVEIYRTASRVPRDSLDDVVDRDASGTPQDSRFCAVFGSRVSSTERNVPGYCARRYRRRHAGAPSMRRETPRRTADRTGLKGAETARAVVHLEVSR